MTRKYEDAPRPGEHVGAAGWCTSCGAAWHPHIVDGQEVCSECNERDTEDESDADRIRLILTAAGLSQRGAARQLDIDERTMRRYCSGELPVPKVIWLALETLARKPQ